MSLRFTLKVLFSIFASFTAVACTSKTPVNSPIVPVATNVAKMQVTSPAFENGKAIPARFTCVGDGLSPPLEISDLPDSAKSLVVMVEDPDVPGTYVHWLLWNWPVNKPSIPAALTAQAKLETGAVQGTGSNDKIGYAPPCPPSGTHHYYFRVYALDILLDLPSSTKEQALIAAMRGHVVAEGELMGTCHKP